MHRFLVCSSHKGREPPDVYIIEASSREEIVEAFPAFADEPIYELPAERPEWLTDEYLGFAEKHQEHRLGDAPSRSLTVLLEHLANGETWEWYSLEERPPEGQPVMHGELGTFRRFEMGSNVGGLPRLAGRWHVVGIEPPPDSRVAAKLIIESTVQDHDPRAS